jgi:hypothetical protein
MGPSLLVMFGGHSISISYLVIDATPNSQVVSPQAFDQAGVSARPRNHPGANAIIRERALFGFSGRKSPCGKLAVQRSRFRLEGALLGN